MIEATVVRSLLDLYEHVILKTTDNFMGKGIFVKTTTATYNIDDGAVKPQKSSGKFKQNIFLSLFAVAEH